MSGIQVEEVDEQKAEGAEALAGRGGKGVENTHVLSFFYFHFLFFLLGENFQFSIIICLKKDRQRSETVANSDNTVQQ